MSKEQTDLLPCPFCSGEAELVHADHGYFVRCMSCNEQFSHGTEASAVAAWNRRASPSPAGGVQGVTVKALEWHDLTSPREDGPPEPTGDIEAYTMIGEYSVCFDTDEDVADFPWCCWSPNECVGHFADFDEAKAAAQSDYEVRILSALSSQAQTTGGVE